MDIQTKKLEDLKPSEYNPRKITKKELERLKASIKEYGYIEPIIWNKRTGRVVGGHQRLKVLQELGHKETQVVVIDVDEKKEKTLNIALNKISGEFDFPKLKDLIVEIDTGEFPIELTGFDYDELSDLISYIPNESDDTEKSAGQDDKDYDENNINDSWKITCPNCQFVFDSSQKPDSTESE